MIIDRNKGNMFDGFKGFSESYEVKNNMTLKNTKEILESFKYETMQQKVFVTGGILVLVKMVENIDVKKLEALEKIVGFNGANIALPSDMNILSLGIAPNVTSRILVSVLRDCIKPIEECFEGEVGEKKAKMVERSLTFFLALANGLMLNGITNAGVLMSILMAFGSLLLGQLIENITKNGIGEGSGVFVTQGILENMTATQAAIYTASMPLMVKLMKSSKKIVTTTRKGYEKINISIFKNGSMPIVLATSVMSMLSIFIPGLATPGMMTLIQSILIFVSNLLLDYANNKRNRKMQQVMNANGVAIKDVKAYDIRKHLNREMFGTNILSSFILAGISIMPLIIGIPINTASIMIVATTIINIYDNLLAESKMNRSYRLF